ncbi:MAG TPA: CopD family protein, partial [Acidimicrobiales bacterium]|nr:CopD family protein [Acidimicrobiales bacterium]
LGFAGLLALVGVAGIALLAAPAVASSRRVRRTLWWSWWVLCLATLGAVAIQGPYASDLPLPDVVHLSLVREVLATRFGRVAELRLVLLAVAAALLAWWPRARPSLRRWLAPVAVLDGVGLLATPGLAGHATTGTAVIWGLLLDLFHLGAAASWLGGLVVLACVLVGAGPGAERLDVSSAARRISTVAMVAVVVVVVSGSLQALRQVGSLGELTSTTYGRLLLAKVATVAVLVGLGAVSRTLLRRRADAAVDASTVPRRRLLVRSVAAELVVAAAVLGVTAGLVNAPPAGSLVDLPYTQSFTTLGVQVNVIVSPASTGVANVLHVYVLSTTTGLPRAVPEVDASISFPADHLGPITLPLTLAGVGHYRDRDVTFLFPGTWVLTVTVRTTPIDEQVTPLQVPVS